jgi:hypothetical protein
MGIFLENLEIFPEILYNEQIERWFSVAKKSEIPQFDGKSSEKQEYFDYDGFWKDLIERFFYLLLKRVLPELYERADTGRQPRPLDKEFRDILNTGTPGIHQSPHFADYVLEVPLKNGGATWILLHVEIQGSGGKEELQVRMYHYQCLIFAHYRREPVALAIITDKRPKGEASFYSYSDCGTEVLYRYNKFVLADLDDDELLKSENPVDLVFYAAKRAASCKEELQKYHYLRIVLRLLAERGWSTEDKRDLMLFAERILNLKDEDLIRQYTQYQKELDKEGKIVYVSLLEREMRQELTEEMRQEISREISQEYLEKGHQKALVAARKMLERRMSVDVIADFTELPEDEIRGLIN